MGKLLSSYLIAYPQKFQFTDDNKRDCFGLIKKITSIYKKSYTEGLSVLANEQYDFSFLKDAFLLIAEGNDANFITDYLENFILFGDFEGSELLKRLIVVDAVPIIKYSYAPQLLEKLLLSFVGEKIMHEYNANSTAPEEESNVQFIEMDSRYNQFIQIKDNSSTISFILNSLDYARVNEVFGEFSFQEVSTLVRWLSHDLVEKVLSNLQIKDAVRVLSCLNKNETFDFEKTIEFQQTILRKLSQKSWKSKWGERWNMAEANDDSFSAPSSGVISVALPPSAFISDSGTSIDAPTAQSSFFSRLANVNPSGDAAKIQDAQPVAESKPSDSGSGSGGILSQSEIDALLASFSVD